ncbi:unnamed protein product [Alopecurus aequalis]
MANKATFALAALVVIAVALATAPGPAHAVCNISPGDFMACQTAATAGATSGPSKECCTAMGKADLKCLCSYKNSPWLSVYNIDSNRVMQLPGKCGLTTPPNC